MANGKLAKDKTESDDELLALARDRFRLAEEAEKDFRDEALDDLKFRAGEQWPSEIKEARKKDDRPCLTINRIPQFVRQVTNDQRQNRPSIKVNPADTIAAVETAKVFQGMIRHIEYDSNAEVAYDTAFEGAVTKGLGYLRVITEYCDPLSFEQVIRIKRIRNSFSVYMDPNYLEPDASDASFAFVIEDLSKDEFKSQYPEAELSKMEDWLSIGDNLAHWVGKDNCRIAEYFYKTFKKAAIVQLSDGSVLEKEKLPKPPAVLPEGLQVVNERVTTLPAIKWVKTNGIEVLEKTDWLGQWIPIIPILGDELDVDGRRVLEGIVRHAKDPQRMYNYWASAETETIALAPRAPWIGPEGSFEGHEEKWKTANTKNHPYLEYKPKTIGGQPAGPPSRTFGEPAVQAITQARAQSSDDMKATTGVYDAALGNRSNENSGVAIQRRNVQSQTSNFHYIDNLSRGLKHLGRILVDLIPKVYDTARAVTILGEDGKTDVVLINQIFKKDGEEVAHYLNAGRYDVTIASGPSFATKREEAVSSMLEFIKAYPGAAPIIGDLLARNLDWPGSQEIADRLKKTLPPGIGEESKDQQQPLPPEIQAKMQQMQQMVTQLSDHLHQAQDEIDQKRLELQSAERIAFARMETDLKKALITTHSAESIEAFRQEVDQISSRLKLLGIDQPIGGTPQPILNDAGPIPGAAPSEIPQPPIGGSSPSKPMEQTP